MKWTQEQRDKACQVFMQLAGMPQNAVELSATAWNASIELACQRNELLWALKDVREFVKRNGYDTALVDSAIAKAESL